MKRNFQNVSIDNYGNQGKMISVNIRNLFPLQFNTLVNKAFTTFAASHNNSGLTQNTTFDFHAQEDQQVTSLTS